MEVTDELLYLYMPAVDAAILKNLESRVDRDYDFSKKFERKMGSLMRREAHPWLEIFSGMSRKAATVMGAIAAASLILTMSVEAYRLKFFETIKISLDDMLEYRYVGGDTEKEFRVGKPAYLPQGYVALETVEDSTTQVVVYENAQGGQIIWEQMLISDGRSMYLDSEYDAEETREIQGGIATFRLYDNGYIMVYYEQNAYVYLVTADHLNIEDLSRMLESIKY